MQLVLDDGTRIVGRSFAAEASVRGEVVFNTGMAGYVEAITDPSYKGQILVLTYPLQGNYGVPPGPWESARPQIQGLVVARHSETPSHHQVKASLGGWLASYGIPAIEGVDTRTLTRHLRERGTVPGALLLGDKTEAPAPDMKNVVRAVCGQGITHFDGPGPRILVIDTGAKESIVRSLRNRGAAITRASCFAAWEAELPNVDGVLLTNGPGDPSDLADVVARLRVLLDGKLPVLGICLGHQLLALAAGAKTYKLKYGHRSLNQPVRDLETGRPYLTSQNHGYAVDDASVPAQFVPWFKNLNDGTNEGIKHRTLPIRSVQFHPEASPGPRETAWLFDELIAQAAQHHAKRHDRSPAIAAV
jgi:carbamoyl-phosphate synthase small subunit